MKYRVVVETVNGSLCYGEAEEVTGEEQIEETKELLSKILGAENGVLQLKTNNNFHSFRASNIVRASIEAVE